MIKKEQSKRHKDQKKQRKDNQKKLGIEIVKRLDRQIHLHKYEK